MNGPTDNRLVALPDLPAMLAAYPPDKKLVVQVPAKALGLAFPFEADELVDVADRVDGMGKPHPRAGVVKGRPKRLLLEVEIDLSTYEAPQAEGQGSLPAEQEVARESNLRARNGGYELKRLALADAKLDAKDIRRAALARGEQI